MSGPRKNGDESSGGRRLYKLVGALVVALVIAAALVPLWLGGGEDQKTRLVKVQPETLNGPSEGDAASEDSRGADGSEGKPESGEGGAQWWQPDGSESASGEPEGAEEAAPSSPPTDSSRPEASNQGAQEEEPAPAQETEDKASGPEGDVASPESEEAADEGSSAPRDDASGGPQKDQKAEADGPFWTVMVGSFREPANAQGLKDRLDKQGYAVEVVTKTIEGRKWRRVYAGRKGSRQKAEQVMSRLKEAGYDDLLVLQAE